MFHIIYCCRFGTAKSIEINRLDYHVQSQLREISCPGEDGDCRHLFWSGVIYISQLYQVPLNSRLCSYIAP